MRKIINIVALLFFTSNSILLGVSEKELETKKIKGLITSFYLILTSESLPLNLPTILADCDTYAETMNVIRGKNELGVGIVSEDYLKSNKHAVWAHLRSVKELFLFGEKKFDPDKVVWMFCDEIHIRGEGVEGRKAVYLMKYTSPGVAKVILFPLECNLGEDIQIDPINININGVNVGPETHKKVVVPAGL